MEIVPSTLPEGDPAPADGALPPEITSRVGARPFGFYVHVPYCASRCGYCDFNTYTAAELGGATSQASYARDAIAEITLARRVLGAAALPVSTVFFGGGTPTLLPPADLAATLRAIDDNFGLRTDAEITVEANPESVDARSLAELRAAGVKVGLGCDGSASADSASLWMEARNAMLLGKLRHGPAAMGARTALEIAKPWLQEP